jgi:hypothetical protein
MKATAEQEGGFKPVKLEIILETQGEVDEFFGVVNYTPFEKAFPVIGRLWSVLDAYSTPGYRESWNAIRKIFEAGK